MRTFIAATALLLALSPQALAEDIPREIYIAETVIGDWMADAWIDVDHIDELPVIGSRHCDIENEQQAFTLAISSGSGLSIDLQDADFDTKSITSVQLDDTTWQYREWTWEPSTYHFVDVEYPAPPPPSPPDRCSIHEGCRMAARVIPAREVRRGAEDPWLPLAILVNEMVHARTLRFQYLDEAGGTRQAELSLDGLTEIMTWCDSTMWSEAARHLKQD